MNKTQHIIKYCAIAFAFFLIFSIISGTMAAILSFGRIIDHDDKTTGVTERIDVESSVSILKVDVESITVTIKLGETLVAETSSSNISVRQDNNKLYVTQKKHNWFNTKNGNVIIYVPVDFVFDDVSIESGAGQLSIESLNTKELDLELGAGKVTIDNLIVTGNADIDGGAGSITITNGEINNLDFDLGVGKAIVNALIKGSSEIDSGIGEVNLNLKGTLDDYRIKLDKGIGSATLDGQSMSENTYYGAGNNTIKIKGGIGSIKITLEKSN